jgi:hypothetical protein
VNGFADLSGLRLSRGEPKGATLVIGIKPAWEQTGIAE